MAKKKVEVIDAEFVPETQPVVSEDVEQNLDMSSDDVRKKVLELKDNIKDDYINLCRLLYHVQKKQMYTSWGFGTFDEYVSKEMEFEKSKARHLIQIWECLYERQSNKDVFSKVMELGWTKASKLVHVVNSENVDNWVEKGKYQSVENLSKDIKTYLDEKVSSDPSKALERAGEVEGTPLELITKSTTLQQSHDDYLATCQAIEVIQKMQPGVSVSQAISLIARDFVASNPTNDEDIDPKEEVVKLIKKYEQMSEYQIVVIDPKGREVIYGFDYLKNLSKDWSTAELNEPEEIGSDEAFN